MRSPRAHIVWMASVCCFLLFQTAAAATTATEKPSHEIPSKPHQSVTSGNHMKEEKEELYWETEVPSVVITIKNHLKDGDDEDDDEEDDTNQPQLKSSRPLFWTAKYVREQLEAQLEAQREAMFRSRFGRPPPKQQGQQPQPRQHPLRTNLWRIRFQLRDRSRFPNATMVVDFDSETGFLQERQRYRLGKWRVIPNGVQWTIGDDEFTAELNLNQFGKHPKMIRGVVIGEGGRKKKGTNTKMYSKLSWFRPVVATFTAQGIGPDFMDTAHKSRGFGLGASNTFLK